MVDRTRDEVFLWGLGTFHAVLAVLIFGIVSSAGAFARFLAEVATYRGALLVGVLWVTACWCTRRTFRGIGLILPDDGLRGARLVGRSFVWGGINGVLFLVCWFFIFAIVEGFWHSSSASVVVFGAIPAFVIGAVYGFLCILLDLALLALFRLACRTGTARIGGA